MELGRAAKLAPEFAKRNVKSIALSVDSVEDHHAKSKNIDAYNGDEPTEASPFPFIDDRNQHLADLLGMLDPAEKDEKGKPVMAHVMFISGPDKKLKLSVFNPSTTRRNFNEVLRAVISLQLTAEKRVATPVDWKDGDSVMVLPTIPEEEAKRIFPEGVSPKSSHLARNTSATLTSLKSLCEVGSGVVYLAQRARVCHLPIMFSVAIPQKHPGVITAKVFMLLYYWLIK